MKIASIAQTANAQDARDLVTANAILNSVDTEELVAIVTVAANATTVKDVGITSAGSM